MFTLEIHAEYIAATLQKKMHNQIYNSTMSLQSHSGPPTSIPMNIFYICACCPHHNENSCAYHRRKRPNCKYLSKFTTENILNSISICMIIGPLEIQVFMQLTVHSNRKNFSSNFSILLLTYKFKGIWIWFKTLLYNSNIILQIGAPECINNLCTCINDSSIKMH